MRFGKHSRTVASWMPLLAGISLSIPLTLNCVTGAPTMSEGTAEVVVLVNPVPPPQARDTRSLAFFFEREVPWLEKNSRNSMFPPNDKKNKKIKHEDDQGEGNEANDRGGRDYERDGRRGGSVLVQMVFGERDREIIRDYCSQPSSNLPPGLAKRGGQLPPGLEKHLRRNGQLPPGLQKKVERFPKELERRLPPLPRNYVRVFIGGRGLIVDAQFNILDVIEIFRK